MKVAMARKRATVVSAGRPGNKTAVADGGRKL